MLISNRPALGQPYTPGAKTSWIGVNACRYCEPYSTSPSSQKVANAQVEIYVPAPVGQTITAKTDGNGWAPVELPVPVGTSVQVSITDAGVTQRKIAQTGADPGQGIVNFQFNPSPSVGDWTPWIVAGGLLATAGLAWWYFSRKESSGPVFEPSLAEVIRQLDKDDLRNVRSKVLKNIRGHCSEVYVPGSPEHEACRTAAAIAAAEVTDVLEEYGIDLR